MNINNNYALKDEVDTVRKRKKSANLKLLFLS